MSTDLSLLVATTPPEQLPELIGQLAAAQAAALARIVAAPPTSSADATPAEDRLLTPEQAAALAAVPVARVYTWARGARWAQRPSRRCLRISERGFRRWLASRVTD